MSKSILINAAELAEMKEKEKLVIIDTRSPEVYEQGHIAGAVNIHDIFTFLATSTPEGLEELKESFASSFGAAGLSGEETAIFYEDAMNTGFGQSCRGYFLLSYLGYDKVKILHGGYQAWKAEGFNTELESPTPEAKIFPLEDTGDSLMVNKDQVLEAIGTEVKLLDVRDIDEWIAESSSPYGKDFCPRKGRLPGAVWIEWYRMMKPGIVPLFKSKEEILAECQTAGIYTDTPVYLYCFKGARFQYACSTKRSGD